MVKGEIRCLLVSPQLLNCLWHGLVQSTITSDTNIFITPGYKFRVVDGLMTNFHLPKSTLMMLVSALMGRERMMAAYDHAIKQGYRFYSYGDSSLLLP